MIKKILYHVIASKECIYSVQVVVKELWHTVDDIEGDGLQNVHHLHILPCAKIETENKQLQEVCWTSFMYCWLHFYMYSSGHTYWVLFQVFFFPVSADNKWNASVLKYILQEIKRVKLREVNQSGTTSFGEELEQGHAAFAYTQGQGFNLAGR